MNVTESDQKANEFLDASQLEQLVKKAVHEAAQGGEIPRGNDDASVLIGHGVSEAIRRAVMVAMKDLMGAQLLQGPLKEAALKVKKAAEEAEALWNAIRGYDAGVTAKEIEVTEVAAGSQPVAVEKKPETLKTPEALATEHGSDSDEDVATAAALPASVSPAATHPVAMPPATEKVSISVPPMKPFEPKTDTIKITIGAEKVDAPASQQTPEATESDIVVVCGVKLKFYKNTNPAFRTFLPAFVEMIKKSPVRPAWAYDLAEKHGWNVVSKGTISRQIDYHLGVLSRWRDEKGDSWWSLPGDTQTPAGTKRFVK